MTCLVLFNERLNKGLFGLMQQVLRTNTAQNKIEHWDSTKTNSAELLRRVDRGHYAPKRF